MTSIKNHKTALVAISAIAAVLAVSTIAIGNGRMALAAETTTITKNVNDTGVNVQTDTNQKQDCLTAGGTSGISGSCTATSTDNVMQSGGIHHK
jgi:hypothetical protein